MSAQPDTTRVEGSRPGTQRSVWGCLTCRRRRVKCQSRLAPCEACRRLHLTCTPSFGSNFKKYRLAGRQQTSAETFSGRAVSGPTPGPLASSPPASVPPEAFVDPAAIAASYMPAPVPALGPPLDEDGRLVVYYKRNLSSFFSVKPAGSNSWSFYTFAIRSSEGQPDSPLRHSILAWTAAHLILRNQWSPGFTQCQHYAHARGAVESLRAELAVEGHSLVPRSTLPLASATTQKLRMLLSTSLFLGYCDILSGDSTALLVELASIRELLESNWPRFQEAMGPLEARILVWLAYLDLRSHMWMTSRMSANGRHERNKTGAEHNTGGGGLFQFLMQNTEFSFSSLRSLRQDRHYLIECFGTALPEKELLDDLLQEPAKRLSDEIMAIFASLCELQTWIEDMDALSLSHSGDPALSQLYAELRWTKAESIRASISRISAESKVVHDELLQSSSGADHEMRSNYHRLVTTAMCLSSTILLNRIMHPLVRTDAESQEAARSIVRIAQTLHASGYVCSPRSLVWPMPVFVAGIEVTDPLYQDWVLRYLLDVGSWGTSTKKARELLRRVMQRQETLSRRVKVGDVLAEFGEAIMV